VDVESLRLHYARTLEFWSANLEARLEEAARLVSEKTLRIWRLYLAGCAYGFRHNWINLHQILAVRPLADGGHNLSWSRADLYVWWLPARRSGFAAPASGWREWRVRCRTV